MYYRFTTLLIILITVISLNLTAKTYYVDWAKGNDSANGISLETPFKHCPGDPNASGTASSINLAPGDVVFINGTYYGQVIVNFSGSKSNPIIFKGTINWATGRATFDLQNTRSYAFKGNGSFLSFENLNIFNYAQSGDYPITATSAAHDWTFYNCTVAYLQGWQNRSPMPDHYVSQLTNNVYNITFNDCEFFASGRSIFNIRYAYNITFNNCDFGGINRGSSTGWFSVAIRPEVTAHNIYITNCKFHDGWQYGGDQVPELNHSPAFIHAYGSSTSIHPYNIYIEGCYFYNNKKFNTGTGTGSLELGSYIKKVYVWNNIFANACQYFGAQLMASNAADSLWIQNNTFIDREYTKDYGVCSIKLYETSGAEVGNNVWIQNNLFWSDVISSGAPIYITGTGKFKGTINNNAYFRPSNSKVNISAGSITSWSSWQALGYDLNSNYYPLSTTECFVSIPSDGSTTSQGNYHINLSAPAFLKTGGITLTGFNKDFSGLNRTSPWSIGAYQFSLNSSNNGVVTNIKIFLSGTFNNGTMSTTLDDNGFLPLDQPYNVQPWNYEGTEKVTAIPNGIVDWILIELRNDTSASSVVARRAAFLKNDGAVVDLDGSSPVLFNSIPPGSYYIVIKHRNHLAVMSANKVNLSMSSSNYNFTDSELKAYGKNPMQNLGNGQYGLYSGDANGDGTVSQSDIINMWLPQFLNSKDGYQSADLNLDGSVTAADNNMYWLVNNGISSQVPK